MESNMNADYDIEALVIGTGLSGIRMLVELRNRGVQARALEAGSAPGGTWYWNRFPGARTDSESWYYCYSFDKGLLDDWNWPERYPHAAVMRDYLAHVVDRFDLRKDIQFDTRVASAIFDDATDTWAVTTESGERIVCRWLIAATGILSQPQPPPFPGVESFKGEKYLSGRWPCDREPDLHGKRVAVIGTGATAIQIIPIVAEAAAELTVFQRTANYALPARNYPMSNEKQRAIKATYDDLWDSIAHSVGGTPHSPSMQLVSETSPEEVYRNLERGWEIGGLAVLAMYADTLINPESNRLVSDFIRNKIRTIVIDPETAELLCPKPDNPFGVKRTPLGHHYYETFNRPNVRLVDMASNPIEITETGVRQANGDEHEFDVIIFATGFDGFIGALSAMDVRGVDGESLRERWRTDGGMTYLSTCADGFPNLFFAYGPQAPGVNAPPAIEAIAKWIGGMVSFNREHGYRRVEVRREAVESYGRRLEELVNISPVFNRASLERLHTWFMGANVPGRKTAVLLFWGSFADFTRTLEAEAVEGFPSFEFMSEQAPAF